MTLNHEVSNIQFFNINFAFEVSPKRDVSKN